MTVQQIKTKIGAQAKAVERIQAEIDKIQNNAMASQLAKNIALYGENGHYTSPEPDSPQGRLDAAKDRTEIDTLIAETRQSLNAEYAAKEYSGVDTSLELLKWNKAQALSQRLASMWKDSPSQLRADGYAAADANSGDTLAYVMALDALGRHLEAQNLEAKYKEQNRTSGQIAVQAELYQLDNLEKEWNGNTGEQLMADKLAKYGVK